MGLPEQFNQSHAMVFVITQKVAIYRFSQDQISLEEYVREISAHTAT